MDFITGNSEAIVFAGKGYMCGKIKDIAEKYGKDINLLILAVKTGRAINGIFFDIPIEGVNYEELSNADKYIIDLIEDRLSC